MMRIATPTYKILKRMAARHGIPLQTLVNMILEQAISEPITIEIKLND